MWAKFSVGAAITGSCGTSMDTIQVGHTSQWYAETGDAADRNVYIGNNFYHDGTNHHTIYEDEVSGIQFRAGTIRFRTLGVTASSVALDAGGGTERMRIDKDGNVGIGTASPGNLLHVSKSDSSGHWVTRFQNNYNNVSIFVFSVYYCFIRRLFIIKTSGSSCKL